MEQTHSLSQPTSSSAQPSVYLNESTHNLNPSPPGPSQSEELFKRSVMLVIWYKAHTTPLRLLHPLPTFPFLQLSQFPSLLSSLSLTQNSFVDAYNASTAQWEQHMIETVRLVASEQRVLYRLRKSLLDGLTEEECPGLQEEVSAQPRMEQNGKLPYPPQPPPGSLKRRATDVTPDSTPPNKYYIPDGMYQGTPQPVQSHQMHQFGVPVTQAQTYPQNLSTPKRMQGQAVPIHATNSQSRVQTTSSPPSSSGTLPKQSFVYSQQQLELYPGATPESLVATNGSSPAHQSRPSPPASSKAPIPHHPHPPLKRWPNDYSVQEVSVGFDQMDALASAQPSLTQRAAFERVFGCRYVKSTVCRHRAVWRRADDDVRDAFIKLGRDERAMWGEFVRRVEGRASGLNMPSTANESDVTHMQGVMQVPLRHLPLRRDEGEGTQEPVMGSLVPPTREEQPELRQHNGLGATMASASGPGQAGDANHVQMPHPVVYDSSSSLADGLRGGDQG